MPPVDAPHIIQYLFEIGPTQANGMGEVPLSSSEILAWQQNTGIELDSWEARILKTLSVVYLNESHLSKKLNYSAPWAEAPYSNLHLKVNAVALKEAMRGIANL